MHLWLLETGPHLPLFTYSRQDTSSQIYWNLTKTCEEGNKSVGKGWFCDWVCFRVSSIYLGKQWQRETSLGERVVKDLSRALVGKYYTIHCDNYFSNVKLFNNLLKDSIYTQKNGSKLSLPCPLNIMEYNKYMGGVHHNVSITVYVWKTTNSINIYSFFYWRLSWSMHTFFRNMYH